MPSDAISSALYRLEDRLNEAIEELEHIRRLLAIGVPAADEEEEERGEV